MVSFRDSLFCLSIPVLLLLHSPMIHKTCAADELPSPSECLAHVHLGSLKGEKKSSELDDISFCSYQGIPYAKPPVGAFRFKDPVMFDTPWDGVQDAHEQGEICMQNDLMFHLGQIGGSEDCLFLNVYTPQVSGHKRSPPRAVMVWIHGGGFLFGSGNDDVYGPDFLVEHNVVLVTFNYRLGVFGFLNVGTEDVPGNAGLKDQALVLSWVRENIHAFGGNPNKVTIFGESAGAASVQYHMLSNLSAGLFHQAILQSGSVFSPWAYLENTRTKAFHFGTVLGINTTDPKRLTEYLRSIPSLRLAQMQIQMNDPQELDRGRFFPFIPSSEIPGTGNNFITENPERLFSRGFFTKVPTIMGINSREGLMFLLAQNVTPGFLNELDSDFGRVMPPNLNLVQGSKAFEQVQSKIQKFYFQDNHLSWESLPNYCDLVGDLSITVPVHRSMAMMAENSIQPVYCYEFAFEGLRGVCKSLVLSLLPAVNMSGVSHFDDIGYLFPVSSRGPLVTSDGSMERKTIERLTTLWTNFAKTGNPNGAGFHGWEPNLYNKQNCLVIKDDVKLEHHSFMPQRTDFWQDIYRRYGNRA